MITIIITPCLLGFDLRVREHNHTRSIGIRATFSEVIDFLMQNWKLDFTIEVK